MRVLIFALLVISLPLRGWMGNAMATQMALPALIQHQDATESIAAHAHNSGAGAHFHAENAVKVMPAKTHGTVPDCHLEATKSSAAELQSAQDKQAQGHCDTCASCQACFSAALVLESSTPTLNIMPHGVPHLGGIAFASAESALGFKPPIS